MPRYLDPKADVVFKKIFADHPHLLKSFLNAVLPLPAHHQIESLEYLPSELVPAIPTFKSTIVDVRCTDHMNRVFIVEMQIQWTAGFKKRMLFNASKAYVKQLPAGEKYHLLKPVYGFALLDAEFDPTADWYHHYEFSNVKRTEDKIKDLQLVFIELPKFKASNNREEKKLQVLWLRFMSELNEETTEVPQELLAVPEIAEAARLAEEAGYSAAELASYERYWDAVSTERTLKADAYGEGLEKGLEKGEAIGLEKGEAIGWEKSMQKIALQLMIDATFPIERISDITGLSVEMLRYLRTNMGSPHFV